MLSHEEARALLEWQIELGATEAIADAPVDRYAAVEERTPATPPPGSADNTAALPGIPAPTDPLLVAETLAEGAASLEALEQALAAYEHCDLKKGARSLVFSDGNPAARVMIIGEAPGRDEDMKGRPFVGRAGQLLDLMFAAIGMGRETPDPARAVYITNVLPWRPPQNRDPAPEEVAMMLPFLKKHVDLVAPDFLVLMGNHSCQALLGRRGITRLRGNWTEALGRPALPMFHPAYLLRNPHAKREAWADLLSLQSRLRAP